MVSYSVFVHFWNSNIKRNTLEDSPGPYFNKNLNFLNLHFALKLILRGVSILEKYLMSQTQPAIDCWHRT